MLEWVSISFFRGSSWPKDRTRISCIVGRFFTVVLLGKPFREEGSVLKDSWNTSTCWEKEKLSCVIKSLENWVSVVSVKKKHCFFTFNFPTSFFLKKIYFYFILLCNTVLVLPYIDMNPPRVYMLWCIYTMEYYSAIKKNTFESVLMRWAACLLMLMAVFLLCWRISLVCLAVELVGS